MEKDVKVKRWKKELIHNISVHGDLRADFVEAVLNALEDVVIDEIVNNGHFRMLRLFEVSAHAWGEIEINGNKKPPHYRLKMTPSRTIKELWKIKYKIFNGEKNAINKNNWREIFRKYETRSLSKKEKDSMDLYNPFIDDDYDDGS